MEIRYSSHGAYHHEYHVVWIPKYRKRVLKGDLRKYVSEHLPDIQRFYPEVEIERQSIQEDHVHLIVIVPPKYSVSDMVGKMKTNTSREVRKLFFWVKEIYWRNEFWSPVFFSSTVGIDEDVIKRYVEFQEKVDTGQLKLPLDFKVPRA
jgi:putative transposase